jgi:hypothetical protein
MHNIIMLTFIALNVSEHFSAYNVPCVHFHLIMYVLKIPLYKNMNTKFYKTQGNGKSLY